MKPDRQAETLAKVALMSPEKILNPQTMEFGEIRADTPVLLILAAGKGTRFGTAPKCVQAVCGIPLARHSINAFHKLSAVPAVCLVGYRCQEVTTALGTDNIYVTTGPVVITSLVHPVNPAAHSPSRLLSTKFWLTRIFQN